MYFWEGQIFEFCKDLHTSQSLAGKLEESWFIGLEESKTQLNNWNTAKNEINKYFKSFGDCFRPPKSERYKFACTKKEVIFT